MRERTRPRDDEPDREDELDETGAETFPASDPPGWVPTHVGAPAERPEEEEEPGVPEEEEYRRSDSPRRRP